MHFNNANTFLNVPWNILTYVKNEEVLQLPLTLQLSPGFLTARYKMKHVQVFSLPLLHSLKPTICEHDQCKNN
jgi:hypothetical protein